VTLRIPFKDVSALYTPPECQGQIVVRSYGWLLGRSMGIRRTYDRSDHTESWAVCRLDSCEHDTECDCYDPANGEPKGFEWERVKVIL